MRTVFTIHWATDATDGYLSARGLVAMGLVVSSFRPGVAFRIGAISPTGVLRFGNWRAK